MFDLWLAGVPDADLTISLRGWHRSRTDYRRSRSMPPANDTGAPISVTSSEAGRRQRLTAKHTLRGRPGTQQKKLPVVPAVQSPLIVLWNNAWSQSEMYDLKIVSEGLHFCYHGVGVTIHSPSYTLGRQALLKGRTNLVGLLLLNSFKVIHSLKMKPNVLLTENTHTQMHMRAHVHRHKFNCTQIQQ